METNAAFARLVARPIDRVHIAASVVPTRDELHAIEGYEVSPGDAALVASFLARDGMSWDELRLPLRYPPEERVRSRLGECVETGVITFDQDFAKYTPAGLVSAQAVLDAHAIAVQQLWSNTASTVTELVALAAPVVDAVAAADKPSSRIIDDALAAADPTDASELWRTVAKIRRHRADCHAEAWAEAGHSVESIHALPMDAPERKPIEDRTDEINAEVWSHLPVEERLGFMAKLASLDGSGTPI